MPDDAVDRVLRLVAEGRLTAEEAGPIIDALAATPPSPAEPPTTPEPPQPDDAPARALRVEVTERGRTVVNLRVPLALGRAALDRIPGISDITSERIREAIAAGVKGPIVAVEDDGDGVRISIE
jgi:hypothetical protein